MSERIWHFVHIPRVASLSLLGILLLLLLLKTVLVHVFILQLPLPLSFCIDSMLLQFHVKHYCSVPIFTFHLLFFDDGLFLFFWYPPLFSSVFIQHSPRLLSFVFVFVASI